MKLTVIGTGYVGLVTGACFSEMGYTVICVDKDPRKIEALKNGKIPIHEPGLEPIVQSNGREGRLRFTTSLPEAVAESSLYMIAVGTPPNEDGSADLQHVLAVARELGRCINRPCTVIGKSTVPVGTADKVKAVIAEEVKRRGVDVPFDVVSNPEFLKEGDAVNDFMRPDRIIVGVENDQAAEAMRQLYSPFTRNHDRLIAMGVRDAEMTKYAANAMLATRISFMNEIAGLCERLGVDVESVRKGIGSDSRIGYSFLYSGCGYGGSCFPKDVKALIHTAREAGFQPQLLDAVEARNEAQKHRLFEKISARFNGNLEGLQIGLWGLAFKPGTDDMREAPSLVLLEGLIGAGARVTAYDPVAMEAARRSVPEDWIKSGKLKFAGNQYEAIENADAMALVTEWKPFRHPDFEVMKKLMKRRIVFDGRNQYEPAHVKAEEFEYFGIGRS